MEDARDSMSTGPSDSVPSLDSPDHAPLGIEPDFRVSVSWGYRRVPMCPLQITPDEILVGTPHGEVQRYPRAAIKSIRPEPEVLAGPRWSLRIEHSVPGRWPWLWLCDLQSVHPQIMERLVAYGYPVRPSAWPPFTRPQRIIILVIAFAPVAAVFWVLWLIATGR
ncbi:hypothetical protein FDZ71_00540 [bacterium]|nr:MAG: hypothetical protein FDZ71_00540 [bacterium]